MRAFLFLAGELFRAVGRRWWTVALWALSVALALAAGTALLLLPSGGVGGRPYVEAILLVQLHPHLSPRQIDELAWEIWQAPGVLGVGFRFPGESEPSFGSERELQLEDRTLVVELSAPEARAQVQELLTLREGVVGVSYRERTVKPPPGLPSLARILALVGLVLALGGSLALARWATLRVVRLWREPLALLRSTGISEGCLRRLFMLPGALAGLAGGAIYVALLWGAVSWGSGQPQVLELVPALPDSAPWGTALGLVIGLLLGVLGGAVGYPSGRGSLIAQRFHRGQPGRSPGRE